MGVTTPTEAAAVGVITTIIIALGYRKLNWLILKKCLLSTVETSVMILFIVLGATIVAGTLNLLRVPDSAVAWVTSLAASPLPILISIYLVYLFLGCFMDGMSMMVVTLPIIYPIIIALGFDPIWFGVALVILIEMAMLTPPVGMNVYVIHGLCPDRPMSEVFIAVIPFFFMMVAGLAIITAFPIIVTWLPATMMKAGG